MSHGIAIGDSKIQMQLEHADVTNFHDNYRNIIKYTHHAKFYISFMILLSFFKHYLSSAHQPKEGT